MRASFAAWMLGVAAMVGGAAGAASCTGTPTVGEACQVLCACRFTLPAEQASCETVCEAQLPAIGLDTPECLQCVVDADDCTSLEQTCAGACQGNPMP